MSLLDRILNAMGLARTSGYCAPLPPPTEDQTKIRQDFSEGPRPSSKDVDRAIAESHRIARRHEEERARRLSADRERSKRDEAVRRSNEERVTAAPSSDTSTFPLAAIIAMEAGVSPPSETHSPPSHHHSSDTVSSHHHSSHDTSPSPSSYDSSPSPYSDGGSSNF